jgi:putative Mg2+ transporter-C (MgtC) family protein
MELSLSVEETALRLVLAILLGMLIGIERELTQKAAGLRTHTLVTLGTTVFTMISISNMRAHELFTASNLHMEQDVSRIAASIVSGIGFIGGGAVLRYGTTIRGLTTAASLWMAASVGMLIGTGNYWVSVMATFLTVFVLVVVRQLNRYFLHKQPKEYSMLQLKVTLKQAKAQAFQSWLEHYIGNDVVEGETSHPSPDEVSHSYVLNIGGKAVNTADMTRKISQLGGVVHCAFKFFQEED